MVVMHQQKCNTAMEHAAFNTAIGIGLREAPGMFGAYVTQMLGGSRMNTGIDALLYWVDHGQVQHPYDLKVATTAALANSPQFFEDYLETGRVDATALTELAQMESDNQRRQREVMAGTGPVDFENSIVLSDGAMATALGVSPDERVDPAILHTALSAPVMAGLFSQAPELRRRLHAMGAAAGAVQIEQARMGEEAFSIVQDAYSRAREQLQQHRDSLINSGSSSLLQGAIGAIRSQMHADIDLNALMRQIQGIDQDSSGDQ